MGKLTVHYLRFQRFHPDFDTPRELLYELADNLKFKRAVEIDYGGEVMRDSVSRLAQLWANPRNESYGDVPEPDFSLYGPIDSLAAFIDSMAAKGFKHLPLSKDEFERAFRKATPTATVIKL